MKDSDVEAIYLPVNVTAVCQLIAQGVLDCTKKTYRHRLLRKVLKDNDKSLVIKMNEIDLLVVEKRISEALTEIEPLTIVKS